MTKLVVNFYGCPNSGKTVAATSLFSALKKLGIDTVLVSEFAHEKVVEENHTALANQLFIWASQQYKIFSGYRHAQVVVTDSPILLGAVYNNNVALNTVILGEHHKYNNLNIVMELDPSYPYSMVGRIHDLDQSIAIESLIFQLLQDNDIPFLRYNESTEQDILDLIVEAVEDE